MTDAARPWPSPNTGDSRRGSDATAEREGSSSLTGDVSAWPTPSARDYKDTPGMSLTGTNPDGSQRTRDDQLARAAHLWPTPRTEDGESAGNHPDAADSLTGVTKTPDLWMTPMTPAPHDSQYSVGRGGKKQLETADQAHRLMGDLWMTPQVPNGGRSPADEEAAVRAKGTAEDGTKTQVDLGSQARTWPTPCVEDSHMGSVETYMANRLKHLPGRTTITSLSVMASHSFPLLPEIFEPGDASSSDDPTSRPLWPSPQAHDAGGGKTPEQIAAMRERTGAGVSNLNETVEMWQTPHGFANTDASGKTAGGGGEFAKQALSASESWSTPRAAGNSQNPKNLPPPSEGGRSSKPGLEDQAKTMQGPKAQLNPAFVAWLMGFPEGWVSANVSINSAPSAMRLSHYKWRMRSVLSLLVRSLSS